MLEFLAVRQLRAAQLAERGREDGELPATKRKPATDDADAALDGAERRAADHRRQEAKARAMAKGPILLFVGPPGVGKTSIAKSIARALGRKYVRISLGGVRDEADIRGHRRTYVGAMPGRIIQGMKQAGTKNPVFLLDEVDKLGVSFQGDPASALLEVLDPAQNDTFTDHYLGVPFDLSEVLFIATANFVAEHPRPAARPHGGGRVRRLHRAREARDRQDVPGPAAARGERACGDEQLDDHRRRDRARSISRLHPRGGVRQLEREIGAAGPQGGAQDRGRRGRARRRVDADDVRELLGRPQVHPEQRGARATRSASRPACTTRRRAATSCSSRRRSADCGDAAGRRAGRGGRLADPHRPARRRDEGVGARRADLRASARRELGIPSDRLGSIEVHVHVPAGAIPKDGPSAGVAMATAMVSALSGRPVRRDVAMTGEITLRGRVLPIGGVKEKVLGAHRAGITTIILPKENEADLEDLPEEVREPLTFHASRRSTRCSPSRCCRRASRWTRRRPRWRSRRRRRRRCAELRGRDVRGAPPRGGALRAGGATERSPAPCDRGRCGATREAGLLAAITGRLPRPALACLPPLTPLSVPSARSAARNLGVRVLRRSPRGGSAGYRVSAAAPRS